MAALDPEVMRTFSLLALVVPTIAAACGQNDLPNPLLYLTTGEEKEAVTYDGVERFEIERIDASDDADRIVRAEALPKTLDLGAAGEYRFRARAFDVNGVRVAAGGTLTLDLANLKGSSIPLFMARTDRASRPSGELELMAGAYPPAAVLNGTLVWVMRGGSDSMTTDSYSFALWQQNTPPDAFESIECPRSPCELANLVISGGIYAVAIAKKWAYAMDAAHYIGRELEAPDDLESWANVAGGRVLTGANETSLLVGPTRLEDATDYLVKFEDAAQTTVYRLNTPRAGASVLSEPDIGVVVAGGSDQGAGVEVLRPKKDTFASLDYPSDPVVGAALAVQNEHRLLRMGGLTPAGDPAPTVRIELECDGDCQLEPQPDLVVLARRAQGYYDADTGVTIVVGEDADGVTVAYRFDGQSLSTIDFPKASRHRQATALELPNQQLLLVGGLDPDTGDPVASLLAVAF
jgi:hypothetical protein